MPHISIPTSFNVDLEFETPGIGRRMLSLAIDMFFQYLYLIIASRIYYEIVGSRFFDYDSHNMWAISLILLLPLSIYHLVMEIVAQGQSVGKKITHIKVVNINGGKPSLSQFLIRWILRVSDLWIVLILVLLFSFGSGGYEEMMLVLFGMAFLITDFILVVNGKKSQRVGDILANTIVIKTRTMASLNDTIFIETADDYQPLFPQVLRISDKDLNIIKSILDNYKTYRHTETLDNVAYKVKTYLQVDTPMESKEFLEKILMDYNHLSVK